MHDFYLVWWVPEGMDGWERKEPGSCQELKGPGHPIPPALFPGNGW